jgi:hypothetical protein
MADSKPQQPRSRIPLGFVGACALIFLVESAIAGHAVDFMSSLQCEFQFARTMSDQKVNRSRILAFGDSQLKLGLASPVLEEATGRPAWNFAIAAGQAPASYFLLRRALETNAQPRAILVNFFPRLMAEEARFNIDHWPEIIDGAECVELAIAARDPGLMGRLLIRSILPSVRYSQPIRSRIRGSLAGTPDGGPELNRVARRSWLANGGMGLALSPGSDVDLVAWRDRYFRKRPIAVVNLDYMDRFFALAEARGIPVFWLIPPRVPALEALCQASGFEADQEAFMRAVLARHPGVRVIDGQGCLYDRDVFMDPHHLTTQGATTFTAEVGVAVRRVLDDPVATPRWIKLPKYRHWLTSARIELFEQSRSIALGSDSKSRR